MNCCTLIDITIRDQPSNFPPGENLKVDLHNAATLKFRVKVRATFPNHPPDPKPGVKLRVFYCR